jgi:hypothetical protein
MERTMQLHNQMVLGEEQRRRRDIVEMSRRTAREDIQAKEAVKMHEREQQQREKELYNQRAQAMSYMESQKESSYKQYYQQFVNQQNRLHSLYERTAHNDNAKDANRQDLVARGMEEAASRQMREYEDIAQSNRVVSGRIGKDEGGFEAELAEADLGEGAEEAAGEGGRSEDSADRADV